MSVSGGQLGPGRVPVSKTPNIPNYWQCMLSHLTLVRLMHSYSAWCTSSCVVKRRAVLAAAKDSNEKQAACAVYSKSVLPHPT